jgi:hypothetical protein
MSTSFNIPAPGNFNGLNLPSWDREMIGSGYQAVSAVEGGWEFLKTYEPPEGQGFMFSTPPPKLKEIDDEISKRYGGHSGASYAMTMRTLQYIAKNGWDSFARDSLQKYGPPKSILDVLQQAATVDSFMNGLSPDTDLLGFATAIENDPGMRKQIPDINVQADALKRFAEGKLTYFEMRSLCG